MATVRIVRTRVDGVRRVLVDDKLDYFLTPSDNVSSAHQPRSVDWRELEDRVGMTKDQILALPAEG